ncbi:unnamed protein product [Allacma fusca]|uniref:Uncharacterized protein n=1 Tax=Allacma fusca TaxID=39272 RepID=A0A8J2K0D1_9HEXA|nr:unnamed protein product [Allacma fusca]
MIVMICSIVMIAFESKQVAVLVDDPTKIRVCFQQRRDSCSRSPPPVPPMPKGFSNPASRACSPREVEPGKNCCPTDVSPRKNGSLIDMNSGKNYSPRNMSPRKNCSFRDVSPRKNYSPRDMSPRKNCSPKDMSPRDNCSSRSKPLRINGTCFSQTSSPRAARLEVCESDIPRTSFGFTSTMNAPTFPNAAALELKISVVAPKTSSKACMLDYEGPYKPNH